MPQFTTSPLKAAKAIQRPPCPAAAAPTTPLQHLDQLSASRDSVSSFHSAAMSPGGGRESTEETTGKKNPSSPKKPIEDKSPIEEENDSEGPKRTFSDVMPENASTPAGKVDAEEFEQVQRR